MAGCQHVALGGRSSAKECLSGKQAAAGLPSVYFYFMGSASLASSSNPLYGAQRFVLKFEKQGDDRGMDSILSLGASFKHLSSTTKTSSPKTGAQGRRSSFTRRASISRRRSLPCSSQKVPDSWLRVYQAELKRERKRQQATLAKKNAERSVRKTHFRSHHCLPRQRSAARKAEAAAKKDDSLFGAFQGLSLDGVLGAINGPPAAAAGGGGDPCKVM
ncbi:uncharacterized protein si:ch211-81a5.8 isoform X2 [Dunckerocampus dactyliophorus]|uniref:uncharacterized protein si:ch211-81a5.8 isoform X2 n=1 Tax=Dunckerocampus dactyliophorus TaxID=161453 RepID=UPI0024071377|nr:uncharacterized protein si:ch211-81a5.8 isoform X2 [Dunckerocampus dactyliophorus]